MNVITRGIRNAFRNSIRTVSIVVILALSVGLALSMLIARQAVDAKIASVKSSIGNTVTVSPAGARGFEGGGEPLTSDQINKITSIAHVTSVSGALDDRLSTDDTNLQSAIEPGTLGNRTRRFEQRSGGNAMVFGDGGASGTFKLPITVTGTDSPATAEVAGGGTVSITSGTAFSTGSNENVAMVGSDLASKNSLGVGSTFQAHGQTITVVAIYDAGNKFANTGLVMPLATVQRLSDQANQITSATVHIDSIENIDGAVSAIQSQLGAAADVVSSQDTAKQALDPLESIRTVATFSLVGAVAAGAMIILLTMIMIVRERRREIGVLKAIGASNITVMAQFMTESVTLTVLAAVAGTIFAVLAASPLAHFLVSSAQTSGAGAMRTAGGGGGRAFMVSFAQNGGLRLGDLNVQVGWDILVYGLLAAIIIALAGSAAAAWLISKIRPAEVMRAE